MAAMTATELRRDLYGLIQQVNEDHVPIEVVSKHGNVVLVAAEDYEAMATTAYLFSNPANAARLRRSIEDARNGRYSEHELIEP